MKKVQKAKPKMKMPPLTFVPCGDYLPGATSLDPEIPLPVRKARNELWREWHRYNRIKLAAALAGDISRERDAKVGAAYAKRKTVRECRNSLAVIRDVNAGLEKYHSVILNHAKTDRAIALLTKCKPGKHKPFKRMKLKEARAMAAKGYTVGYTHDGITVTFTPENYKQPMNKLVAARLAHDAAHEAKFRDVWKCKCASHYPNGDLTKPRIQGGEFSKARRESR
jgi:hypothetical protein